ncbi:plasmodesmata-located protein 2-like [Lotus japonicus]|uniref:plasmodesmata-located protein 2-like n=1 Tax=Lotus japonicus TaxID=34305 RepID=UPI00258870C4|nr:plasmodesmata-located protein 2-like [Lotus japonicus]
MIRKRYHIPFLFLFTVSRLLLLHPMSDEDNSTKLVYKDCAEQKLHDPSGIFSQNLKALLASLVELSGQKAFSTTTSGSGENVIMGMFQCRGDLSNPACCSCVSKISDMLERGELCSNLAAAARVQLSECYLRYEVVGFEQVPETLLLYKVCGPKQVNGIDGFEKRRDLVFGMVESGVRNGGKLFYTVNSSQSFYVLGQCEGDLANNDCVDCVKSAEDQAKIECGDSTSAEIYLHKCYISYTFYPNNGVCCLSPSLPGTTLEKISSLPCFDLI